MNRPIGRVATCTVIWLMIKGSFRNEKNWLRNERRAQEISPRNHIRNVHTGRDVSSSLGTVNRTSSIGETSSSFTSCSSLFAVFTNVASSSVVELTIGASVNTAPIRIYTEGLNNIEREYSDSVSYHNTHI